MVCSFSFLRGSSKSRQMINGEFLRFTCLSGPHVELTYIPISGTTPSRT